MLNGAEGAIDNVRLGRMSYQIKPISKEAIPAALEKAQRYRLLNEPAQAESICLDILEADPGNQSALVLLLLARTDQFDDGLNPKLARDLLPSLESEYERCYYAGIICERAATAMMKRSSPGSSFSAYDQLRKAMEYYEKAGGLRPHGNDDPILRWNTCARLLMRNPELRPRPAEAAAAVLNE